jgi:hypothetical protein
MGVSELSAPSIVQQNAPIVRLHPKEAYPPIDPDVWLEDAKLYWYTGGKPEVAFDGPLRELFSSPVRERFRSRERGLIDLTRPWESSHPKPRDRGFALTALRDPQQDFSRSDAPVPVFYELVEDSYVTYWLFYPWSTVPRRIPDRESLLPSFDPNEQAELADADAALTEAYPDLVQEAVPPAAFGLPTRGEIVGYIRAWLGPRWPILHEGDWEGICVDVGPGRTRRVAYFQHGEPQTLNLNEGARPQLHVALGSHASYPDVSATSSGSRRFKRFERLSEGDVAEIELIDVRSRNWYGFGGAWGAVGRTSDETGPLGPGEKKGPRPFATP